MQAIFSRVTCQIRGIASGAGAARPSWSWLSGRWGSASVVRGTCSLVRVLTPFLFSREHM